MSSLSLGKFVSPSPLLLPKKARSSRLMPLLPRPSRLPPRYYFSGTQFSHQRIAAVSPIIPSALPFHPRPTLCPFAPLAGIKKEPPFGGSSEKSPLAFPYLLFSVSLPCLGGPLLPPAHPSKPSVLAYPYCSAGPQSAPPSSLAHFPASLSHPVFF